MLSVCLSETVTDFIYYIMVIFMTKMTVIFMTIIYL